MKKLRTMLPGLLLMLMFILLLPIRVYADDAYTQERDNCYQAVTIKITRPKIGKSPATSASAKAYYGEDEWAHDKSDPLTFVSLFWEERAKNTASWKKMTTTTFREGYYYKAVISFKSMEREFFVFNDENYPDADQYSWSRIYNYDNYYYEYSENEAGYVAKDQTSAIRLYHAELTFPKLSKITAVSEKSIKMTVDRRITMEEVRPFLNFRENGSTFSVKKGINNVDYDFVEMCKVNKGDYYIGNYTVTTSDKKKVEVQLDSNTGGWDLTTYGCSTGKCYITVSARLYRAVANYRDIESESQWNPVKYGTFTWKIPVQVSYSSKSPEMKYYKFTYNKKTKTFQVTIQNASTHTIVMEKGTYTVKNPYKKKLTVKLKKNVSIKTGQKKVITYNIVGGKSVYGWISNYVIQARMKWNGKTGTIGLREVHASEYAACLDYKVGSKKYKVCCGLNLEYDESLD